MAAWTWEPLAPERWPDLARLFGPNGACAGCWCMYWRAPRAEWRDAKGDGNREALRALVAAREPTGILGYLDGEAAAWCSVAPREQHAALEASTRLKRVDDAPVWSITCFYVARRARGQGAMRRAIDAACAFAASRGATIVEAYPTERDPDLPLAGAAGYMGLLPAFERAGFEVVARRAGRPIVRKRVAGPRGPARPSA